MSAFKPMLAVAADINKLRFPLLASPKLDGIRASVVDGKLLSRTLKPIPNREIYKSLSFITLNGLDGELIVGKPTDKDVYRNTTSGVMSHDKSPLWRYYVFDDHSHSGEFQERLAVSARRATGAAAIGLVFAHEHKWVDRADELLEYESTCVDAGYEGLILRDPRAPYKHGRSTAGEGWMLKLKRFEDSEAVVIGVEEEQHNGNLAETNELGRTKRSTAKAGKVGKGTMGALIVRDVKTGVEFNIGTGFTAADRADEWANGLIVKYKHFEVGAYLKPRHPVYLGRRDKIDL
jgi:DNA ligase-1